MDALGEGLRILDVPAGNGLVVDALRQRGHDATGADINDARDHFVRADMSEDLPFVRATFDVVTCLEVIEHVVDETHLLTELIRVLRPGGTVVISTPNVMNLYSRWHTFLRGYPFQFPPSDGRHVAPGECRDRGHVNPLSYVRLRYLLEHHGCDVTFVDGDRTKRKWMMPLLLPVAWIGDCVSGGDFLPEGPDGARQREIRQHLRSRAIRFQRSLIVGARKRD